jgi:hypothetical protein
MVQSWAVHTPVNAAGKKWIMRFVSLKSSSETCFLSELKSVNEGALSPFCNAMMVFVWFYFCKNRNTPLKT